MDELEAEQQDQHVSKRVSALLRLCGADAELHLRDGRKQTAKQ